MQEFLNRTWLGNTMLMYITAAGIFILAVVLIFILKTIILKRLKKWAERTSTTIDDFIIRGIEKTVVPLLYFGGFYSALNTLNLDIRVSKALNIISAVLVTYFSIRLIANFIRYSINSYIQRKGEPVEKQRQVRGILTIINVLVWGLGLVFLLDNLGFEISAVIAGLGIGGIAIALAAQSILGDLFSYFIIFFDRPFEIGDFIVAGDKSGSVEYLGIKTTRLRSLGGEQIIISNTDLVNSRVHNYKRMERRRVLFTLGVKYDTGAAQLEKVPQIIKAIIENSDDTTFDRAHFIKYSDFSLIFEVVYYVLSADYNRYLDIHQKINLDIYNEFEKQKIHFAYPTQTLYVNKSDEQ